MNLATLVRKYPPHRLLSKAVREWFRAENYGKPFPEEVLYYAARDVYVLVDVYLEQLRRLEKHSLLPVAHDEMDCIPCTAEMELTGVCLDRDRLQLIVDYYEEQEARLAARIRELLPAKKSPLFGELTEVINLQSNAEKLRALRRLGLQIDDVRRDTLEKIDLEVCQLLGEYTKLTKVLTTYGRNLLKKIHPDSGRVHPRFSQLGLGESADDTSRERGATIATGRYSSDFQQIPRPQNIFGEVTDEKLIAELSETFSDRIAKLAATA